MMRTNVAALNEIMGHRLPVLDHGFIRLLDYMGDDADIVQAARISYGTGTRQISEDRGLIRYLLRHQHTSPFEMCEIKLHVKLPIFVARQWIRHRTASVNEYSARYSILESEYYIPTANQLAAQSASNKQGRDTDKLLDADTATWVQQLLRRDAEQCAEDYRLLLGEQRSAVPNPSGNYANPGLVPDYPGLARELARINLTLNTYTEWYWKTDLHNLLHFLRLRLDQHAQFEIRAYAEIIAKDIVQNWVPLVWEAFCDYQLNAYTLSAMEVVLVRQLLARTNTSLEKPERMSPREWREFNQVFGANNEPNDQ